MEYSYVKIDPTTEGSEKQIYEVNKIKKIKRFILKWKIPLILIFIVFLTGGISFLYYIHLTYYTCEEPIITDELFSKIKGESYFDKYGIDVNQYITNEIYSQKIPNNDTLDNWELYTPPCPNLEPIHYSEEMKNPKCEDQSIQIVNFKSDHGKGRPYSLHLHSITNQIKNWNEWSKNDDKIVPNYYNKDVKSLISDTYHPFDYGYYEEKETELTNEEDIISYYKNVVTSRMDEVPDPRHRRIFSFILFNTEFDLLDIYLSQYYELFDYFVIYESNATFSGKAKPLYFTRMLLETDRYDKFKDKIIAFPYPMSSVCNFFRSPFTKEHLARRHVIEMGLRAVEARHGDIFMHGDLDEMPKPHVITRLKKCGGWEHLQAGIGGGPQSSHEKKVDSYLQDKELNKKLERDKYGFPKLVYDREISVGILSWSYEYSFEFVDDPTLGTKVNPNIAIFDARRALGQYPKHYEYTKSEGDGNIMPDDKYSKWRKRNSIPSNTIPSNSTIATSFSKKDGPETKENEESYVDPLTLPNFDPYQGYSYTRNENDDKDGEGYLGEYMRFITVRPMNDFFDKNDILFWSGGWHMSNFLPTIDHLLNKVLSYSHFDYYFFLSNEQRRQQIIDRIKNRLHIFGKLKYYNNTVVYPESPEVGYQYDFSFTTWQSYENENDPEIQKQYNKNKEILYYEIPEVVLKNPICYSYMIDRQFGLEKKI